MKQFSYLSILCFLQVSCSTDDAQAIGKKNKEINLATSQEVVDFEEPQVLMATFDVGFEDEYRTQPSTGTVSNTYMFANSIGSTSSNLNEALNVSAPSRQKNVQRKKKIIKNGAMRIKTSQFDESKKQFDKTIKSLHGYYESEALDKNEERIQYDLVIRVPAKNFELLVQGFENGNDEVLYKKINTNDVTEEFLDIETRLANKRKYLKRYNELLEKANNVDEILSIEENIRQLMEEIESKEGRLKYLNDQMDISTLRVILFKEFAVKKIEQPTDPFTSRAGISMESGWDSIIDFVLWVVSKWPMILLLGLLAWIARRRWRKRKQLNG